MKRNYLTLMFLVMACTVMSGCKEKEDGCESYSPWPSANAMAAWREYSPNLLDSLGAYNNVFTTLNYFGHKPSWCHDSICSLRDKDSVLISGYLKLWRCYGDWCIYMITDSFREGPIDTKHDSYLSVNIITHYMPLDTLKRAYIPALFRAYEIPEEYDLDYCCSYDYKFYVDTEEQKIRYEE